MHATVVPTLETVMPDHAGLTCASLHVKNQDNPTARYVLVGQLASVPHGLTWTRCRA